MKVNLWFARNNEDEIVSIVNSTNENEYHCPICSSKVIPKALESEKMSPHFAHVDVTKCNSESMIHFWMKYAFIEKGDKFSIKTDEVIEFTCKDFNTEVTYQLESGTYRPDLVIQTECGQEVVFEMANTNKKKVQDYIDKWIELDKIVVEVDIKALQNESDMKEFSALYYKGKCFNFNKRDGGYYNTIGKLKEEMKSSGEYDIELVKKLDWFWNEVSKIDDYSKITEEVVYQIDLLCNEFKYNFISILMNNNCSNVKRCYIKYKIEKFKNKLYIDMLSEDIDLLMNNVEFKTIYNYDSIQTVVNIFDIQHKRYQKFSSPIKASELLKRNLSTLRTNRLLKDYKVKCENILKRVENDEYLKDVLEKFHNENEDIKLEIKPKFLNKRTIHQQKSNNSIDINLKLSYQNFKINLTKYTIENDFDLVKFNKFVEEFIGGDNEDKILEILSLKNRNREIKDTINERFSKYGIVVFSQDMSGSKYEIIVRYRFKSIKYALTSKNNLSKYAICKDIKNLIENETESICKDCRLKFTLTIGELDFYNNKEYTLPKRCKDCRQKRKQNK